ncbi:hypothetical protein M885DRAFT_562690 [Pelagophyceae sp. CCMP2097]|nr:hypothetical protein M885DRAFT_562690 [Pelagophyceae sp. CCMP2097]
MKGPSPRLAAAVRGTAAVGGIVGPCVDAVHNGVLLAYDAFPVDLPFGGKTSLLIPPLLAAAYVVLGVAAPAAARRLVGEARFVEPRLRRADATAAAAFASTVAIIKLSEVLCAEPLGLPLLALLALLQWALLDGTAATLAVALAAAVCGPVAELPLIVAGCWHYVSPDYFPFDGLPGLAAITGPCYAAVATDAGAIARSFAQRAAPDEPGPAPGS